MVTTATSPPWNRIALQALIAGIAGGVFFDAYVYAATIFPSHGSMTAYWLWIASTVFGKPALGRPAYAWAGLAIHFIVSIGWAGGYAYVAAQKDFLNRRWIVSGIVYGAIVYLLMQLVLLADQSFALPSGPRAVAVALIGHCAFFGLPVAATVRALSGSDSR